MINRPNHVREWQIFFNKPSHQLLYLRGPKDKAIWGALCGLMAVGTVGCVYKSYLLITGQKPAA
ncbi:hypothetical protein CONCODRAFT_117581 [Conidiobolus coronatus NRRL 28638]|uniref:Uncharacterized protein n=1 Tax=Conidiobolus coronatus (strain ATCC 28846 / CBS 209.66 / NRRL 28638) TaxID=796925 RepID=A0A137NXE5_CONC2|nr:hypothetical protein CONCODRAFT_117581 [Conidiobolus coronatus NRRL 28638]|eukprot:KXN67319.1 hypothetical protein CONCODRAFT_117581 [Conidiobolus coronatus NRRL 28638]